MQNISRRDAFRFAAAGTLAASLGGIDSVGLSAATPAAPVPFDITPYVDPELRFMIPRLLPMSAAVPTDANLASFRHGASSFTMPTLPAPAWTEQNIPGVAGAPDVKIYIVNAKPDGPPRPVILHTHGGGFIIGSARSSLRFVQEVAQSLDCLIVTVEYRLAPETRFPGSLEDNYAALKWVHAHAGALGGDPKRIAVMGESAGGGHAAMLAIAARDRGEVPIVFQALIYPMLDDRTGSTRKVPPYMGALIWTPAHNRYGWTALLGVPAGSARVPAGAVPARLENLKGLPPAFIGVGSIDLFVNEDVDYARRLIDSGIATQLEVIPGAFHGFDAIPGSKLGPQFRETLVAALRKGLAA
jgi:acetyl esterase/lipase